MKSLYLSCIEKSKNKNKNLDFCRGLNISAVGKVELRPFVVAPKLLDELRKAHLVAINSSPANQGIYFVLPIK